jgi:hypothetical protein
LKNYGYKYSECYYNHELSSISYCREDNRGLEIEFRLETKKICVFYKKPDTKKYVYIPYISMNILKAINEKCKELGWLWVKRKYY